MKIMSCRILAMSHSEHAGFCSFDRNLAGVLLSKMIPDLSQSDVPRSNVHSDLVCETSLAPVGTIFYCKISQANASSSIVFVTLSTLTNHVAPDIKFRRPQICSYLFQVASFCKTLRQLIYHFPFSITRVVEAKSQVEVELGETLRIFFRTALVCMEFIGDTSSTLKKRRLRCICNDI